MKINLTTKNFAWAGVLIVFDAFIANQGVVATLVGLWMLFVSLPRAALSKNPEQKSRGYKRVAIFLGAVLLVFVLNWANNQIARSRAETLVTAIKAFNQKYQRYPEKLDELVPVFIDHIPDAKYTLIFSSFKYISGPEFHSIFYIALPPFGRPTYYFEGDKWGYLD
ncbi:MAG: hypothetical protein HY846_08900 [Nitrosomonadales bacterium]|nr:hypothetical protein [Nitrosomonadales bacterium]